MRVNRDRAARGRISDDAKLATSRTNANRSRGEVFVEDRFVGHVAEFGGLGRAMLVVPGTHRIRIALPGYETFETDINPLPKQKVDVKTDLVKSDVRVAEPLLKGETSAPPTAKARDARSPPR